MEVIYHSIRSLTIPLISLERLDILGRFGKCIEVIYQSIRSLTIPLVSFERLDILGRL